MFAHEALQLVEGPLDVAVGELVGEGAGADALRERGAEDAVAVDDDLARGLLVGVGGDAVDGAREAELGVEVEDAVGVGVGEESLDVGEHGGHDAVDGDGLAVAELEGLAGLEGPGEAVAEVHGPEQGLLPEVGSDALEHGVDRALDDDVGDVGEGRVVLGREAVLDEPLAVGLHEVEELGVVDERRLHDLAAAAADVGERERREEGDVDEGVEGGEEVADAVLSVVVDGDLDPDRGVDHAEERGGHARPGDAAPPERAGEARRVGQDAAPDSQDRLAPSQRVDARELVEHVEDVVHRLLVLVPRSHDRRELEAHRLAPGAQLVAVQRHHRRVHDAAQPLLQLERVLHERIPRREQVALLPYLLHHPPVVRLPLRPRRPRLRRGWSRLRRLDQPRLREPGVERELVSAARHQPDGVAVRLDPRHALQQLRQAPLHRALARVLPLADLQPPRVLELTRHLVHQPLVAERPAQLLAERPDLRRRLHLLRDSGSDAAPTRELQGEPPAGNHRDQHVHSPRPLRAHSLLHT
mmetsp:Transcript_8037/g.24766  ORF Transcript_8037/g.24766 Transcript_8037/m.24766 type:complete len:527 (-) Transcript_8037:36-1616(-)